MEPLQSVVNPELHTKLRCLMNETIQTPMGSARFSAAGRYDTQVALIASPPLARGPVFHVSLSTDAGTIHYFYAAESGTVSKVALGRNGEVCGLPVPDFDELVREAHQIRYGRNPIS